MPTFLHNLAATQVLSLLNSRPTIQAGKEPAPSQTFDLAQCFIPLEVHYSH
jgi:hypothetical protein